MKDSQQHHWQRYRSRCAAPIGSRLLRGLTLVELMVVLVIVAVLLMIAVPSFKRILESNRISTEINALVGDYQYARSEAVRTGLPVTMCVSENGTSCSTKSKNWHSGWIVFNDLDGDHELDDDDEDDDEKETVLRVHAKWASSDTLIGDAPYVTFNRSGFATTGIWTIKTTPENTSLTRCMVSNIAGQQKIISKGVTLYGKTCGS